MDKNSPVVGLIIQTFFLFTYGVDHACCHEDKDAQASEYHIGKCTDHTAAKHSAHNGAHTIIDEFSFKATVNKGLLEPPIELIIFLGHTPKNALMTTLTRMRNRQEPPHDISSFEISWSPLFHLI